MGQKSKTQNMTKLENLKCDKTQNLKFLQNSTTQKRTKLKKIECDKTKKKINL